LIGAAVRAPSMPSDGLAWRCVRQQRSVRSCCDEELTKGDLGQLLWAAQGVAGAGGGRTVPSAGALYPLEL